MDIIAIAKEVRTSMMDIIFKGSASSSFLLSQSRQGNPSPKDSYYNSSFSEFIIKNKRRLEISLVRIKV
jgi:hypothetical protein